MNIRLVELDYKNKDKKGYIAFYTSENELMKNIIAHHPNLTIKEMIKVLEKVSDLGFHDNKLILIENNTDYHVYKTAQVS